MKILVIGDFHGKFLDSKIKSIIKKEHIELIISLGDYLPFYYRELWFKYCYGKDVGLWEVVGDENYAELIKEDLRRGEKIISKINKLPVPIITVLGNIDYPLPDDVSDKGDIKKRTKGNKYWDDSSERCDDFTKILRKYKNIKRIDYSYYKFKDFVFIGMRGHSSPGYVKSKNFKKHKLILEKLFNRFSKENKNKMVIFISHNIPYNTRLDIIKSRDSHKQVCGKHYGSKLARRIIEQQKPFLTIGGHIHESFGKDKISETVIINSGAIVDKRMVVLNLPKNKKDKLKINFIK